MHLPRRHFRHINLKAIAIAFILFLSNTILVLPADSVTADERQYLICSDFMFIFARGSGAEVNSARDFQPFKAAVDEVFGSSGYSYSFYELGSRPGGWSGKSYPAPGIGISSFQRFSTSIGALLSGGEYNDYGDSVEDGSDEALVFTLMMHASCPNTKLVLAGYSQGAQVVSRTLQKINPNWIYAALTFGDPKLYLPEGKMNWLTRTTAACRNENLSEYRAFVPDCYAYEGILGGYHPYQPSSDYSGKLKAYCQFHDVICSSAIDFDNLVYGHASYASQGTYKRGIEDLYNMVAPATYTRPVQDVAILFDITDSMRPLLAQFQSEAIAVARRTLAKGGKVALYTYGDLDEVKPAQLCNFETCTADNVESYIKGLKINGGKDLPESLLSASYTLMRELKWDMGANKSLVVLTDAGYHNPDRDGITESDVVSLSKSIDPVNFYILTTPETADSYSALAAQTDGGVYTSDVADALDVIEAEILSRDPGAVYVSTDLPTPVLATLSNLRLTQTSTTSAHLDFDTDGTMSLLTLNDMPAGYTTETSIEITDLDFSRPLTICVAPVSSSGHRGETACITSEAIQTGLGSVDAPTSEIALPKAPNTGKSR